MQQLLVDTAFAAGQRFPGKRIRVWYVMLGKRTWRGIIINSNKKTVLAEGPNRATPKSALVAIKNQLEAAVRKTSQS
jgi:hypothetical protein